MDEFLNAQSPAVGSSAEQQRASGFFSNLFRGNIRPEVEVETDNTIEANAFILPEPASAPAPAPASPTSPSAAARQTDHFFAVPVMAADPEPTEEVIPAGPASVVDVPMPSVSAAASVWQRLTHMTIGRKAKPIIPYYARATTEASKPVARPAGRVNLIVVPSMSMPFTAPGPTSRESATPKQ